MSKNHVHRREFLHLTATGASAATVAAFLASCQSRQFNTKVANTGAAGGKFRVRKKWGSADATKDMETYVKAVALLRANDAKAYQGGFYQPGAINAGFEVRQTWSGLAWIHFASCPHGNWYFVPWHRVYLNYFEAACATVTGEPDFALPYWDWTSLEMPEDFFNTTYNLQGLGLSAAQITDFQTTVHEANDTNPLLGYKSASLNAQFPFDRQQRRFTKDARNLGPEFAGRDAIQGMLAIDDFYQFASSPAANQRDQGEHGQLEGLPHNNTHGMVGGFMGMMLSPLDPIFWLHHCNVDRMWEAWRSMHGDKATPYRITVPGRAAAYEPKDWAEKKLTLGLDGSLNDAGRESVFATVLPAFDMSSAGSREAVGPATVPASEVTQNLVDTLPWGYVYDEGYSSPGFLPGQTVALGSRAGFTFDKGFAILAPASAAAARSTMIAPVRDAETRVYPFDANSLKTKEDVMVATFSSMNLIKDKFDAFVSDSRTRASLVASKVNTPPSDNVTAQLAIRFFLVDANDPANDAIGDTPATAATAAALRETLRNADSIKRADYVGSYSFFADAAADMAVSKAIGGNAATHMHMTEVNIDIELTSWIKAWRGANPGKELPAKLAAIAVFVDPDPVADRHQNAKIWLETLRKIDTSLAFVARGDGI
jgi:hypothetical protein